MFSRNVADITEKYNTDKDKLKQSFITRVTGILSGKVLKKASLELGIEELSEARDTTAEEITTIINVLKENM